jgi:branched-subunit amino acid ABC-type transport system permease component
VTVFLNGLPHGLFNRQHPDARRHHQQCRLRPARPGIVTAFGPLVYRLAYQSLADASSLVLLIVSVGVHFAMTGLGLLFFGAEGFRNPSFWDERICLGPLVLSGQA